MDFFILHPFAQSGVHHSVLLDQRFACKGCADDDGFEMNAIIAPDNGLGAWQLFFNQMCDVVGLHSYEKEVGVMRAPMSLNPVVSSQAIRKSNDRVTDSPYLCALNLGI